MRKIMVAAFAFAATFAFASGTAWTVSAAERPPLEDTTSPKAPKTVKKKTSSKKPKPKITKKSEGT